MGARRLQPASRKPPPSSSQTWPNGAKSMSQINSPDDLFDRVCNILNAAQTNIVRTVSSRLQSFTQQQTNSEPDLGLL